MTIRAIIPYGWTALQADIDSGAADSLTGGSILIVAASGQATGKVYEAGPAGQSPSEVATSSTVASAVSKILVKDWAAATAIDADEVRRATVTAGTIEAGDLIRSNSARTTGAAFDGTEAGNWTEIAPDIVTSVAGKTGAVSLTAPDVGAAASGHNHTGTYEPADAGIQTHIGSAHAPSNAEQNVQSDWNAASGDAQILNKPTSMAPTAHTHAAAEVTGLATVNGQDLTAGGNVAVSADLAGGTAQTALDDGLESGNAVIDRTTVAGQTILRYETAGAITFKVPDNVNEAWLVAVAGGAGGGDNHGGGGGAGEYFEDTTYSLTPGATITGTVGAGGLGGATGSPANNGANGTDTTLGTLTVNGGGGGAARDAGIAGADGGSGGGGSGGSSAVAGASVLQGGGTGNAGGAGSGLHGGGGGGSSAVGTAGSTISGIGGLGTDSTITGATVHYAAGGTGGTNGTVGGTQTGAGAGGSAGAGSNATGVGSGGGGGGGAYAGGGNGSRGGIIIRFATQSRTYTALQSFANDAAAITGGVYSGMYYFNTTNNAMKQVA